MWDNKNLRFDLDVITKNDTWERRGTYDGSCRIHFQGSETPLERAFLTTDITVGLNAFVSINVYLKIQNFTPNLDTYDKVFKDYVDQRREKLAEDATPFDDGSNLIVYIDDEE